MASAPFHTKTPIEFIDRKNGVEIYLKRDDRIHPQVSGNKWRKLKYYFRDFQESDNTDILTFGAPFSNHLAATASAGWKLGVPTHGLVRGHEVASNPTLDFCRSCGMKIDAISRGKYASKDSPEFLEELRFVLPHVYIIPEGGKGPLGTQGCTEILSDSTDFDAVCVSAGTGTTAAGLLLSPSVKQLQVFPALKGAKFMKRAIMEQAYSYNEQNQTAAPDPKVLQIEEDYHFGGYARVNDELVRFMNGFYQRYQIALDPVYTGKLMYGIWDSIEKHKFEPGARILAIHTGGLQGIAGMNRLLAQKGKETITYEKYLDYHHSAD